jgi:hypothetical protein
MQVVDNVLKGHDAKGHDVSDQELYNRARGLLLLGAIFKSTIPDESDAERRELERCVAPFSTSCLCASWLVCRLPQITKYIGWLLRLRSLKRGRRLRAPRYRLHRTAHTSYVTDTGTGTRRPVTRPHRTRTRSTLPPLLNRPPHTGLPSLPLIVTVRRSQADGETETVVQFTPQFYDSI